MPKFGVLLVGALLVGAMLVTAGCLDDLSTLGYCSGTKTSSIHIIDTFGELQAYYFVDSNGIIYKYPQSGNANTDHVLDGHTVTFTYYSDGGHLRIGQILADHTACVEKTPCLAISQCPCAPCCPTPTPTPTPCPCQNSCNRCNGGV